MPCCAIRKAPLIGLLHSDSGDPPDVPVQSGVFFWAELLASNPDAAARFYSSLAGYSVDSADTRVGPQLLLSASGFNRAGIMMLPPSVKQSGWLPFVQVDDLPSALSRVAASGGKLLVEPRAELLGGRLAVIADPRGGVLGLADWNGAVLHGDRK